MKRGMRALPALLAAALPTLCGTLACLLVNGLYRLVT